MHFKENYFDKKLELIEANGYHFRIQLHQISLNQPEKLRQLAKKKFCYPVIINQVKGPEPKKVKMMNLPEIRYKWKV